MATWQQANVGGGTLIDHSGGRFVDRGGLVGLHCPEPTDTWKPVPHSDLIGEMIAGLKEREIVVKDEKYCISGKDDARIFGVLDVVVPHLVTPDYSMVIAIQGANDKSLQIKAVTGAKVFCCSNLSFSGDSGTVVLKRKHTSGLDLKKLVPPAIDVYLEMCGQFAVDIDTMKNMALTDAMSKECIYDAFIAGRGVMPIYQLQVVHDLYFKDESQRAMFPDRSLWSLNNAFTEAVKRLKPASGQRASLAIGRHFSRAVAATRGPQGIIDVSRPEDDEIEFA